MHSRRQTRSPLGEPRSKASPDRKVTTKWSSVAALVTIFALFVWVMIAFDWYGPPSRVSVPSGDAIRFTTEYGDVLVLLRPDFAPRTVSTSQDREIRSSDGKGEGGSL